MTDFIVKPKMISTPGRFNHEVYFLDENEMGISQKKKKNILVSVCDSCDALILFLTFCLK